MCPVEIKGAKKEKEEEEYDEISSKIGKIVNVTSCGFTCM